MRFDRLIKKLEEGLTGKPCALKGCAARFGEGATVPLAFTAGITCPTLYRKPRFLNRVKTKCARCGVNNVPKHWKKVKRPRMRGQGGKSLKKVCNGRAQLCRQCQGKKGQHNRPHILAPSIKNRAESILNDIHKLSATLPISKIVVEIASFDTQKMASANIEGVEYQHGTLFGYEVKQYLLIVHKHKYVRFAQRLLREPPYCGGLSGDNVLEVEHILPQSKGGTDKVSNLTISCKVCNETKGSMTLDQWERVLRAKPSDINEKRVKNMPALRKQSKLKKGFQYSALTQSYKNYLLAELRKGFTVEVTFGATIKYYRNQLGLPKSQINDALVIASEGKSVKMPQYYILEKQIKKRYPHDYISPPKKGVKYKRHPEMFGFRLWDKVKCKHSKLGDVVGYIQGRRSSGSFAIASLDGELLIGGITYKKLTLLKKTESNYIRERRAAFLPS